MAGPIRIEGTTDSNGNNYEGGVREMTTTELTTTTGHLITEKYASVDGTSSLRLRTSGSVPSGFTDIGTFTDRKRNDAVGTHPTDAFAQAYGDSSWYCGKQLTPRASIFESDTIFQLDFSMAWDLGGSGILKESRFKVDIFNILGQDGVDDMNEYGESGGPTSYPYQYYQLPISFQYPRSIRLGIEARF